MVKPGFYYGYWESDRSRAYDLKTIPEPMPRLKVSIHNSAGVRFLYRYPPIETIQISVTDSTTDMMEYFEPLIEILHQVKIENVILLMYVDLPLNGIEFMGGLENLKIEYITRRSTLYNLTYLTMLSNLRRLTLGASNIDPSSSLVIRDMPLLEKIKIWNEKIKIWNHVNDDDKDDNTQSIESESSSSQQRNKPIIIIRKCPKLSFVSSHDNIIVDIDSSKPEFLFFSFSFPNIIGIQPTNISILFPDPETFHEIKHLRPKRLAIRSFSTMVEDTLDGIEILQLDDLIEFEIFDKLLNVTSFKFIENAPKLKRVSIQGLQFEKFVEWNSTLEPEQRFVPETEGYCLVFRR
jgi:hypothetical protein